jgi:hypothetical protein
MLHPIFPPDLPRPRRNLYYCQKRPKRMRRRVTLVQIVMEGHQGTTKITDDPAEKVSKVMQKGSQNTEEPKRNSPE